MSRLPWDNSSLGLEGWLTIFGTVHLWSAMRNYQVVKIKPSLTALDEEWWEIAVSTEEEVFPSDIKELEAMLKAAVRKFNKNKEVTLKINEICSFVGGKVCVEMDLYIEDKEDKKNKKKVEE